MQEDSKHSALELRIKQSNRYVSLAIVCILGLCLLLFVYVGSVKQSEDTAKSNQAVQAQVAIDSNVCKTYPEQELCVLARKIAENPDQAVTPKDGHDGTNGKDGSDGKDGLGISKFSLATGSLIVTYTDGHTQNLGTVVGKDGAPGDIGATGPIGATGTAGANGRGILTTDITSGSLIIGYSDGTTHNAGIVVGPKGDTGAAGANGTDGTNGTDGKDGATGPAGLTPTAVDTDAQGYVTITYSDGSKATAGRVLMPTVEVFSCTNGELTLKMSNGAANTIPADCSPDDPILAKP